MPKVLVVEDDLRLATLLRQELTQEGHQVESVHNGTDALTRTAEETFDLVILDLNLPDIDGIEVATRLRQDSDVSILMLTARGDVTSRVEGLYAGASDYLTKPFHPEELGLRIAALLRRVRGVANQPLLQAAGLALDEARQCVVRGSETISLSAAEFRLLRCFLLHPGQILSKTRLNDHLYDGESERDSNVIEVHVNHLRRKLGREVIETRRGQGYRLGGVD